jgi:broad specificity phosphatase PhoE
VADTHAAGPGARQRLWLMRHGESEWNASARWQGHGDPPLSPRGLREASAAAARVAARVRAAGRPLRLFSSDLLRARQTASPVAAVLGLEVTPLFELRELDVGRWSGLTREQIRQLDPDGLQAFDSGNPDVRPGGGETRQEIRDRVRSTAARLAREHPGHDLLLVVHRGVIRALVPGLDADNLELVETTLAEIEQAARAERAQKSDRPISS